MKTQLIAAASLVIPNPQMLINVVSRRVRQLSLGHRPLVSAPPGMQAADIALTEIVAGKLTYEADPAPEKIDGVPPTKLVAFPDNIPPKKKAA